MDDLILLERSKKTTIPTITNTNINTNNKNNNNMKPL